MGKALTDLRLPDDVSLVEGLDWYWGWPLVRALRLLAENDLSFSSCNGGLAPFCILT